MQLNISGHHIDITKAIKEYSTTKLLKIKQHFDSIVNINMILEVEKDTQKAEAIIRVRGADLFAKAESNDMYKSIDKMVDRLDVQVKKYKAKLNNCRKN